MKRLITISLVAAFASISPVARTSPPPKPQFVGIARCVLVVVISTAGAVITYYVKRWCDHVFSNQNYYLTNEDGVLSSAMPPLYSSATGDGTTTIQSASGLGSAWVDGYSFNIQQVNGTGIVAVAFKGGVAMATNRAPITEEGQTIVLDFRKLLPSSTNPPAPCQVFRLVN